MSKPPQSAPAIGDELIQEEALRVARRLQKPGQTKEETKLIAQGIAKGITLYKKEQSAKTRERDKARKKAMKLRQTGFAEADAGVAPESPEASEPGAAGVRPALLVAGALCAVVALAHLARVWAGWSLTLGPWTAPVWVSPPAAALFAGLAYWFFHLAMTSR